MDFKRLDYVCNRATLQYANSTVHNEVFPCQTWYCIVGAIHLRFGRVSFWLHSCRVKNGCVCSGPTLKHGPLPEVIVRRKGIDEYKSRNKRPEFNPPVLIKISSERLESRPTLTEWIGWSTLFLAALCAYHRSHTEKHLVSL